MTDLIQLMSKLVTPQGHILVPGISELVAPLTDEERYALAYQTDYKPLTRQ
jgi:Cys-Gly metallodipeptidase DUG1